MKRLTILAVFTAALFSFHSRAQDMLDNMYHELHDGETEGRSADLDACNGRCDKGRKNSKITDTLEDRRFEEAKPPPADANPGATPERKKDET